MYMLLLAAERGPEPALALIVAVAFTALIFEVALVALLVQLVVVGAPNEVVVLTGRGRLRPDGSLTGYRELVAGGRALRLPVVESVGRLSLQAFPLRVRVRDAFAKGGARRHLELSAVVAVSSDPEVVPRAIERFLGQDRRDIEQVAAATLEAHARAACAADEDVDRASLEVERGALPDLRALGLELLTARLAEEGA
ncbi:MAG: hypothetical protein AB7N76_29610 [Planctomycetota bacterium]